MEKSITLTINCDYYYCCIDVLEQKLKLHLNDFLGLPQTPQIQQQISMKIQDINNSMEKIFKEALIDFKFTIDEYVKFKDFEHINIRSIDFCNTHYDLFADVTFNKDEYLISLLNGDIKTYKESLKEYIQEKLKKYIMDYKTTSEPYYYNKGMPFIKIDFNIN